MPNPVIAEAGDFALSIAVTLTHFDGTVSTTRGVLGRLPQSPGQLEGSFSDSAWCCWCEPSSNSAKVEYLTANSIRWRVLDAEQEQGAAMASVGYGSVRYMLIHQEGGVAPPVRQGDFDRRSFSPEDFRTD